MPSSNRRDRTRRWSTRSSTLLLQSRWWWWCHCGCREHLPRCTSAGRETIGGGNQQWVHHLVVFGSPRRHLHSLTRQQSRTRTRNAARQVVLLARETVSSVATTAIYCQLFIADDDTSRSATQQKQQCAPAAPQSTEEATPLNKTVGIWWWHCGILKSRIRVVKSAREPRLYWLVSGDRRSQFDGKVLGFE